MGAYRLGPGQWFCFPCSKMFTPEAVQGPFPDGGGAGDGPRFCFECGAFLQNPLTEKGIVQAREYIAHHRCHPEAADELREFYGDVL